MKMNITVKIAAEFNEEDQFDPVNVFKTGAAIASHSECLGGSVIIEDCWDYMHTHRLLEFRCKVCLERCSVGYTFGIQLLRKILISKQGASASSPTSSLIVKCV